MRWTDALALSLDDVRHDLRFAVRSLSKDRGFTTIAVLTLAIGIGANAAIFSVIRTVLFKPPPYADPDRLALLAETAPGAPGINVSIAAPNFLDWLQQNTSFEQMAAVTGGGVTLSRDNAEPVYVDGRTVSASYFEVFGMHAALGRTFAPQEDRPARSHVVVLSHRLWTSQFGADPTVIGKSVRLDGQPYTVIGVMPAGIAADLMDPELWRPRDLGHEGGALTLDGHPKRDTRDLNLVAAKLKHGLTLEHARAEMTAIADRVAKAYPASNAGWSVRVEPWPRPIGQNFERSLYVLFAAVAMVLLIGCVNVANLLLGRAAARGPEMAIRAALGAGRGRLVRQGLTESLLIALAGGLCGLVVGEAVLAAIRVAIPAGGLLKVVPAETTIVMDAPVWLFAFALSLVTAVAFGLGPAVTAMRSTFVSVITERGGPRLSTGPSQRRLRQILTAIEVAVAFVLLTIAGLLIQSLLALQQRSGTGFESTNVLTARLPIPARRFSDPRALNAYLDRIAERIQALPGIRAVAFTDGLPTELPPLRPSFQIADQPPIEHARRPASGFKTISPSYFSALGLRMVKGRPLTERDREGAPFVVVVNETFARTFFAGVDPIGKRLLLERHDRSSSLEDVPCEIVGLVADEGLSPWTRMPEALRYATREQNPSDYLSLMVRGGLDPTRLQSSIRKAVSAVDRDQALTDIRSVDQLKTEFVASDRLRSQLLGAFAAIAVALTAVGLYGVLSYTVVQRRREIGIRAAVGARPVDLVTLVVRQGMTMTVWGLAFGLASALAISRLLSTLVVGIVPYDLATIAGVAGLLTAVALLACYVPARRTMRIDPIIALRCD